MLSTFDSREALNSVEQILQSILRIKRHELYLKPERKLTAAQENRFLTLVDQRRRRQPLAYILQEACFWREQLYVDPRCLIPRPETEILVEQFLKHFEWNEERFPEILDLGCGSGAIGIAIGRALKNAKISFLDLSKEALDICRTNVERYHLEARSEWICSDLFAAFQLSGKTGRQWDAILSNPPYVAAQDQKTLEPELGFEPWNALNGGPDGLEFYRRILAQAGVFIRTGGCLVLEVGRGQAETVKSWIEETGSFKQAEIFKDHNGIHRVVMARK